MMKIIFCTLISKLLSVVNGYNILGVFFLPARSHFDVFAPVLKGLLDKGNNVTVIGFFPLIESQNNYRYISLRNSSIEHQLRMPIGSLDASSRLEKYLPVFLKNMGEEACKHAISSPDYRKFIEGEKHFDVIITEFFNSDCALSILANIQAPVIGMTSCGLMPWTSKRLGNSNHPGYIPNVKLTFSDRMTFLERLENTLATVLHQLYYDYVILSEDKQIIRRYVGEKATTLEKFIAKSSLILVNSHFSFHRPRPYVPNIIEIGGIHITGPETLPKNIETWINESTDGVIYFSLGSMLQGDSLPAEKREAFLNAFKRFPQRVLWKWESERMDGSDNKVLTQKWMPQFDILSHPNVKLFITHGGLLGTMEGVHNGVPMIVIPQYGDQFTNAKALEAGGGGVILYYEDITEDNVYNAVRNALKPTFRQKAKEMSERFRDRPMPPLDTAIYWVEYVIRHKGAYHMRSAAADMPFYQYYLLDVFGFLAIVFGVIFYIIYTLFKLIIKKLIVNKSEKIKVS